jgi:hypothetical protein
MDYRVSDLERHLVQLCKQNRVRIEWKARTRARAWRRSRKIRIQPICSRITYAVALHELGHVLGPQSGPRLNKETQAWQWAKNAALTWERPMESKMQRSLQSYLKWCQRRKNAWVPPREHPAWLMAAMKYPG